MEIEVPGNGGKGAYVDFTGFPRGVKLSRALEKCPLCECRLYWDRIRQCPSVISCMIPHALANTAPTVRRAFLIDQKDHLN